jgi:membrane protein implicated in regulation of membrane protease activity
MSKRRQSDSGGAGFAIIVFLALLWWLRWLILAAALFALVVIVTRWLVRGYAEHRAAEQGRLQAMRQRAEIQNAQVVRGDPHGFYGQYPLPDPELIPRWYKAR